MADLDAGERRRVATQAVRDGDADALLTLVEAYLVTCGKKGAKVAARTLEAYEHGVRRFVTWGASAP